MTTTPNITGLEAVNYCLKHPQDTLVTLSSDVAISSAQLKDIILISSAGVASTTSVAFTQSYVVRGQEKHQCLSVATNEEAKALTIGGIVTQALDTKDPSFQGKELTAYHALRGTFTPPRENEEEEFVQFLESFRQANGKSLAQAGRDALRPKKPSDITVDQAYTTGSSEHSSSVPSSTSSTPLPMGDLAQAVIALENTDDDWTFVTEDDCADSLAPVSTPKTVLSMPSKKVNYAESLFADNQTSITKNLLDSFHDKQPYGKCLSCDPTNQSFEFKSVDHDMKKNMIFLQITEGWFPKGIYIQKGSADKIKSEINSCILDRVNADKLKPLLIPNVYGTATTPSITRI
jgi:hypothetical protein